MVFLIRTVRIKTEMQFKSINIIESIDQARKQIEESKEIPAGLVALDFFLT